MYRPEGLLRCTAVTNFVFLEAPFMPELFRELSALPRFAINGPFEPCVTKLTLGCSSVALTIWGFGLVWLSIAIASIIHIRTRGERIPFNMGWWGFTFPIGVFTSATLQFGTELDSPTFKVLGTILTVTLILLWLTVSIATALKAWNGVM
ncbi:hypothetical protein QFC19_001550 [Naganishia cerealis]|uniref:Uncharacterized protein n=1 Tax=Naganishia cerealis TaxID=610337 RepID=A0ACC2WFA1_9TREE|nr:hypothetical protein QFC19_001550 [Naganishia cerealis]